MMFQLPEWCISTVGLWRKSLARLPTRHQLNPAYVRTCSRDTQNGRDFPAKQITLLRENTATETRERFTPLSDVQRSTPAPVGTSVCFKISCLHNGEELQLLRSVVQIPFLNLWQRVVGGTGEHFLLSFIQPSVVFCPAARCRTVRGTVLPK